MWDAGGQAEVEKDRARLQSTRQNDSMVCLEVFAFQTGSLMALYGAPTRIANRDATISGKMRNRGKKSDG